jgi:hypothetical protein
VALSYDIEWDGDAIEEAVREAAGDGLLLAAEHVLQVANEDVPLDEGTLERSGTTSVDRENLKAAVTYDTPYAHRQHEDLTFRHLGGRKAKWLESAINSEKDTVGEIVAATIRRATRS